MSLTVVHEWSALESASGTKIVVSKLAGGVDHNLHHGSTQATGIWFCHVSPELTCGRINTGQLLMWLSASGADASTARASAVDGRHICKPAQQTSCFPPRHSPLTKVGPCHADELPAPQVLHLRCLPEERCPWILEDERDRHSQQSVSHTGAEVHGLVPVHDFPSLRFVLENRQTKDVLQVPQHLWAPWLHPRPRPALARDAREEEGNISGPDPSKNKVLHFWTPQVKVGTETPIEAEHKEACPSSSRREPTSARVELEHDRNDGKPRQTAGLQSGDKCPLRT